ncbi:uncharacterized protein YALI1_F37264g [Yarrowia lipolytica]|uniref:Uncharacterized protein n=1 Tax=Yarrowia lipolytica TaxID=4952 RepID=A0A1D8NQG4_YARLL|nr:hypothetical protein YALI1_F37264g [Yarrowia lipolytica]
MYGLTKDYKPNSESCEIETRDRKTRNFAISLIGGAVKATSYPAGLIRVVGGQSHHCLRLHPSMERNHRSACR